KRSLSFGLGLPFLVRGKEKPSRQVGSLSSGSSNRHLIGMEVMPKVDDLDVLNVMTNAAPTSHPPKEYADYFKALLFAVYLDSRSIVLWICKHITYPKSDLKRPSNSWPPPCPTPCSSSVRDLAFSPTLGCCSEGCGEAAEAAQFLFIDDGDRHAHPMSPVTKSSLPLSLLLPLPLSGVRAPSLIYKFDETVDKGSHLHPILPPLHMSSLVRHGEDSRNNIAKKVDFLRKQCESHAMVCWCADSGRIGFALMRSDSPRIEANRVRFAYDYYAGLSGSSSDKVARIPLFTRISFK
ncbi:hypothetical protein Taro_051697, partial [Colocasia esculenta]|nr:hypothetical protein [Colocasia esculenta]